VLLKSTGPVPFTVDSVEPSAGVHDQPRDQRRADRILARERRREPMTATFVADDAGLAEGDIKLVAKGRRRSAPRSRQRSDAAKSRS